MTTIEMYNLADQLKEPTIANLALLNSYYNYQDVLIEHNNNEEAMNIQNKIDLLIKDPVQLKVVCNACYGGFSVSHKAQMRIYELKNIKVIANGPFGVFNIYYYTNEKMPENIASDMQKNYMTITNETKQWLNKYLIEKGLDRDICRHDPDLIQAVEELGNEANGYSAKLIIESIKGNKYQIDEYDGFESIITPDKQTWIEIKKEQS